MKNQSVSDFVAATMDAVLNSKEHKDLFATQYKKAKDSMCAKHGKMDSCAADDQEAKSKKSSSSSSSDSSSADDDNDARKSKKEKDSDKDSCMADDDNDARKHKKDSKESSSDSSDADDDNDARKKKMCKECDKPMSECKCDKSDADDHDDFDTSSKAGQHLNYERDNGEYDKHFDDDKGAGKPVVSGGQPGPGDTGAPGHVVFTDPAKIHANKADTHSANTLASSQKNPYPPSFDGPPKVMSANDKEMESSAAYDVAIDSLLTASAALDSVGLGRGSALTLKIASLVVEAKKKDKKDKDSKKSSKDSHSAKDKKSKDSKKDDKKSSSKDSHSAKDKKSDKKDDKKSSKSSSSSSKK